MNSSGKSPIQRLGETIGDFFKRNPGIDPARSIVAYSGGIDSSCLLDILALLGKRPARAVYVDHNLRDPDELEKERTAVGAFCAERGIALTIATIKPGAVASLARRKGIGIEAAAREFRYRILCREASMRQASFVFMAHQEDDLLETMLFRMLRGSSVEGLKGIAETRNLMPGINLVRPFLAVPRSFIAAYVAERGVPFVQDSTNEGDQYARNRLRHRLIPVLDAEFPGWRSGLLGTRSLLEADALALREAENALINGKDGKGPSVSIEAFRKASPALQGRILGRLLTLSGTKARFSRAALASAARSLAGGTERLRCYDRSFSVSDGRLKSLQALDFRPEHGYFFKISSEGKCSAGGIEVYTLWTAPGGDVDSIYKRTRGRSFLVEGSFEFPLVIRTRMPGDRIAIEKGSSLVDDLMKAWGIKPELRKIVPIVEDSRGIAAVLPGAMENPPAERELHRYYSGPLSGRQFFIRVKGV
ncbi:MAG: tRNA lysidine(34) synthetase TilS [Spirochaetes bacterium]|nr:tRNA lysidine(34) synthetase TilS [Spirochaetota bacterium]